jgi:hypothetical protein
MTRCLLAKSHAIFKTCRNLFVSASCNLRKEVEQCNISLYGCMSPERIAADKANWNHLVTIRFPDWVPGINGTFFEQK